MNMRIKQIKPMAGIKPHIERARGRLRIGRPSGQLPPPDPATRVEHDAPGSVEAGRADGRRDRQDSARPIVVAGLAGLVVAAASKLVDVIDLPSSSEVSVAVFGVTLVGLGLFQRYGSPVEPAPVIDVPAEPVAESMPADEPVMSVDLPSLTGEIAGLLAQLRREYGLAYRTTTWLEVVLPAVGFVTTQPELARDLLAVSALDAGAIRADVTPLTEVHATEAIVGAGSSLLVALAGVRDACEQRDVGIGDLPPSDPSTWPSATTSHTGDDVTGPGTGAGP